MQRINITTQTEDDYGDPTTKLVGWFNADKAECWDEATRWDGNNNVSIPTGGQWNHERLYRTSGFRWVMYRWSQWQGSVDSYEFIGADAAREWLLLSEHDDAVERVFGAPVEPERGPGRPGIGPMVNVRMSQDMIDKLDVDAEKSGLSRAALVRRTVSRSLGLSMTPRP